MNEWALMRMRQTQVYQQGHHAAGHMTGHRRCSALIQTKDLGKWCLSFYSSFWYWYSSDFVVESHTFVFIYRHVQFYLQFS